METSNPNYPECHFCSHRLSGCPTPEKCIERREMAADTDASERQRLEEESHSDADPGL